MMRQIGLIISAILLSFGAQSQTTQDTMDNPYWIDMMQDPSINFYKTQRAFELYWQNRPYQKGSGYKPFKRWEQSMFEIIDGQGNIPSPGSLDLEVEKYLKSRSPQSGVGIGTVGGTIGSGSATCQTTGNWVEIGPDYMPGNRTGQPNGLGRLNAVAFHPTDTNTIYVGAPAGGFWRSYDGGVTWATNTDSLASLGVSAIAVDPSSPDTIYIGTGDRDGSDSYGRGVFKTTDGGDTWVQMNTGMGNRIVGKLYIDPRNTQIILAATNGGVYRSTNGGSSWTQAIAGNFKDMTFDAVNPDIVYACQTSAKVYKSTNNGASFTQLTNGLPSGKYRACVAVTPDDTNFVYVLITNQRTYQGLYLSTDRGASFTQMSNSPNIMDYSTTGSGTGGQAWYDLDLAIDPNDKSVVNVCGVNIFQSLDSGKTWKINAHWTGSGGAPAVHADHHVMEYQPGTDALFSGNDGGLHFTKDLGKSWTELSEGLGIAQIYRIGQSATVQNTMVNGYQDNGTGWYENGKWFTVVGGDGMDCVVDPSDVNYAYSALYYGDVRRIRNGYSQGTIAKNGKNGITESGGWVTPYCLREGNPGTMFIGYKNIWRSTNIKATSVNSVTWTKISNNVAGSNGQNIIHVENSPANSDILYVSRSGNKFFKSTNVNAAAPTWTDLTSNLPNNSSVLWIESHATNPNRVWICQSNKVYQSDNGGSSWNNISTGLPNIPILSLVFDSSSKYQGMYAGTYMGVFYRDTTMTSWIWYNDNMPINTRVRDIEIYYSPNGRSQSHVVCGTYGRGNWRSPLYDEDQLTPVAGFEFDNKRTCQGQTLTFSDTSLNLPTNWYWKFSPNTVSFVNGTDSCSQNAEVQFTATGTYDITFYAENCVGYDSVIMTGAIEVHPPIKSAPCEPHCKNPNSSAKLGVYGVQVDAYNFTSSGTRDDGSYVDLGCTEIMELKTDTFYLSTITTGPNYKEYVHVYIDFNNDGDFDDTGELVWQTYEKPTHSDTLKIPSGAVTNTLLRMRVMSDYNQITGPCDTLNYGQTEDYGIILDASIPTPNFGIDTNRICRNEKITLTDSSTGPIYNQRWVVSKYGLLTYKSDSAGPITFILPDTGWYYAELILNDSIVSKRIDSIVYVAPYPTSTLSIIGGSATACVGDNIRLKNTTDQKTGTFSWWKNNVKMGTLSDSIITLGNVAVGDSGTYHSEIEYNGCTAVANSIKVSINPLPIAQFSVTDRDSCLAGNFIRLQDNSTISTGSTTPTWHFGGGTVATSSTPLHNYSDTGTYVIRLVTESAFGCTDTLDKIYSVHPDPTAGFTHNNSPQCLATNNFIYTNTSTISKGSLNFNWDLGDGSTTNLKDVTHAYGTAGTFDVSLIVTSDQNCDDTTTIQVDVANSPVADFDIQNIDSCSQNNNFDFINQSSIASGIISQYDWDFGNGATTSAVDSVNFAYSGTGAYSVRLIALGNGGCRDTISKTVRIHPSPIADIVITDTSACFNGHSIIIGNNSSLPGGGGLTYTWDFGDMNTSSSTTPPAITYASEGDYLIRLNAETSNGCISVDSQLVRIFASPVAAFEGDSACVGEAVQFTNNSTIGSGTIDQYNWSFGDGQVSSLPDPNHVYLGAGTYEVKLVVVSDEGCSDSLINKTAARVFTNPKADFTVEKLSSFDRLTTMLFTEQALDGAIWTWTIDGTNVSGGQTYEHTFSDTGTYNVGLWVESANGCRDSISQNIFVFPDSELLVPTSFSPNDDNLNDVFKPLGVSFVKEYEIEIFNRWGNRVFESTDPNIGWDGTYGGKKVMPGQYVVIVRVTDFNNLKSTYNGMLTISR